MADILHIRRNSCKLSVMLLPHLQFYDLGFTRRSTWSHGSGIADIIAYHVTFAGLVSSIGLEQKGGNASNTKMYADFLQKAHLQTFSPRLLRLKMPGPDVAGTRDAPECLHHRPRSKKLKIYSLSLSVQSSETSTAISPHRIRRVILNSAILLPA
jgi:hypothetical protein